MRKELLDATRAYIDATNKLERMKAYQGTLTKEKLKVAVKKADELSRIRVKNKIVMLNILQTKEVEQAEFEEWYEMISPFIG